MTGVQTCALPILAPAALTASGAAAAGSGGSPSGIGTSGHARLMADFVSAVREDRPPLVTGEEGRRSLALVLAVYESARTGHAVRPSTKPPSS